MFRGFLVHLKFQDFAPAPSHHVPLENSDLVHALRICKHVSDFRLLHHDSVLPKQGCDLAYVQRAAPIFVELVKHLFDVKVSLNLAGCLVVVGQRSAGVTRYKPAFEVLLLQ